MFNFEKLETWHQAIEFADLVYDLTRGFPADERFGLTNQMRRAAVSVSSNLAAGSSRSSRPDFARFVEIGTGSLFEVVSQSFIGRRQGFLTDEQFFAWGWRVPFLSSASLVLIGLYVRLTITETPVFREALTRRERVKVPMAVVFTESRTPLR